MGSNYVIVESSRRAIQRRIPESGDFWCRNLNLNMNAFDIEAGDLVGACIYDLPQTNRKQMDIVGQANGYSLMQMSAGSQIECGDNSMPSSISSSQLSTIDSRILHLYATITSILIYYTPYIQCHVFPVDLQSFYYIQTFQLPLLLLLQCPQLSKQHQ